MMTKFQQIPSPEVLMFQGPSSKNPANSMIPDTEGGGGCQYQPVNIEAFPKCLTGQEKFIFE
jgi:hypothetical protein